MNTRDVNSIAANVFKSVTATTNGNTAVWTPSAGKKFRILAYSIETTADAATSGGARIEINLQDGSTNIGACKTATLVPAIAATSFGNNSNTGQRWMGAGYLSSTVNNVLNINLSAALTSGEIIVNVIGTEE